MRVMTGAARPPLPRSAVRSSAGHREAFLRAYGELLTLDRGHPVVTDAWRRAWLDRARLVELLYQRVCQASGGRVDAVLDLKFRTVRDAREYLTACAGLCRSWRGSGDPEVADPLARAHHEELTTQRRAAAEAALRRFHRLRGSELSRSPVFARFIQLADLLRGQQNAPAEQTPPVRSVAP